MRDKKIKVVINIVGIILMILILSLIFLYFENSAENDSKFISNKINQLGGKNYVE